MTAELAGRRSRALIISDVTGPGGVGTHIGQLALEGRKLGWNVSVLMDDGRSSDVMAGSLRQLGVSLMRRSLYHGFHTEDAIRRAVWNTFDEYRPDIVHVQCGSPRSAIVPRELALEACLPLIITENFVPAELDVTEEKLRRLRQIYQRAFAAIAVCDENLRLLRERFGLYASRQLVIRYGVELPPDVRPRGTAPQLFKAVTVARLTPRKGIDVLIRAVAVLTDEVRSQFVFTVVGDGEQRGQLQELAEDLRVAGCIKFVGWSDDVRSLLRAQDLFILPSLAEGQPIALLEALAAELPCIASAVSGIPEVLGEGEYGALVNPNDPAALSAAVSAFARDPKLLQRKSSAARPHLRLNHDPKTNTAKVIALWHDTISSPR